MRIIGIVMGNAAASVHQRDPCCRIHRHLARLAGTTPAYGKARLLLESLTFSLELPYRVGCCWGCAPVDRRMIDRSNRALRDYLLCARGFMEARSQVGGDSRRALSRS